MTFRELLEAMRQHAEDHPGDEVLDRGIVVRVLAREDNGGELHVGSLRSVSIDAGCTDKPALVLDADQGPDDTLDDDGRDG